LDPPTIREDDCQILRDHPRLRVLGAPLRQVFLMKLFAARSRTRDVSDLVSLWPRCGFESPQQAVTEMYETFPHEDEDPHLVTFVASIAEHSAGR